MNHQTTRRLSLTYVLLSPTFGMHQYTADLANRMATTGCDVRLVTTAGLPRDRYAPQISVKTPFASSGTGFSVEGARWRDFRRVRAAISDSLVHFTGVHLWNLPLVWALQSRGVPVVHTIHDLDPHYGRRFGGLIRLWNRLLLGSGCHVLVHARRYRNRLFAQGLSPQRVTYAPLLHLFLGYDASRGASELARDVTYEPWALFFGRLERYKGVDVLLQAQAARKCSRGGVDLVLAGSGPLGRIWEGPLPAGVELRKGLIEDEEALELFRRCGLVVLPYRDASQSALIAAAYYFQKPVVVTEVGALPEYVEPARSGWVVPAGDPAALADCLQRALSDPGRLRRMGRTGRAWYESERRGEWETVMGMYARRGS